MHNMGGSLGGTVYFHHLFEVYFHGIFPYKSSKPSSELGVNPTQWDDQVVCEAQQRPPQRGRGGSCRQCEELDGIGAIDGEFSGSKTHQCAFTYG